MTNIKENPCNYHNFNALHLKIMEFFFFVLNPSRLYTTRAIKNVNELRNEYFLFQTINILKNNVSVYLDTLISRAKDNI